MEKGGRGGGYRKERRKYKKMCEEKKRKEMERWEREVGEVEMEMQVWKIVTKERRRKRINKGIGMEEWNGYFKELLGGVGWRVRGGEEEERGENKEGINKEEIKKVVRNLKDGKAMGSDRIPNEVWKYEGQEVERCLWE